MSFLKQLILSARRILLPTVSDRDRRSLLPYLALAFPVYIPDVGDALEI